MTLVKFKNNPDRVLGRMFNPIFSDVFDNMLNQGFLNDSVDKVPAVNIYETKENFKVELAAPGLSKEDFKISLDKDLLTISSEKKAEQSETGAQFSRKEFSYHSFKRSFNLPEMADKDQIAAEYKDGVLILTISKKEEVLNGVKEIRIS